MVDKDLAHRSMSNNSIYFKEKTDQRKTSLADGADALFRGTGMGNSKPGPKRKI